MTAFIWHIWRIPERSRVAAPIRSTLAVRAPMAPLKMPLQPRLCNFTTMTRSSFFRPEVRTLAALARPREVEPTPAPKVVGGIRAMTTWRLRPYAAAAGAGAALPMTSLSAGFNKVGLSLLVLPWKALPMALALLPTAFVLPAAYRMIFQNSMRTRDMGFGTSGTMGTEESVNKTPTAPTPTATPTSPSPSDAGRKLRRASIQPVLDGDGQRTRDMGFGTSGTMGTEESVNKTPTAPTPTATPTSPSPSDAGRKLRRASIQPVLDGDGQRNERPANGRAVARTCQCQT
ncbi:hypothetical protein AK812_SmicGene32223 [Symbiodinium microadriaticum]|uniref:Uncharacterized protein n=1 Tax=Symbiodinium microadriaticum TaxID=2951 RepID=A0A1Q9CUQ1_SYMMI|nr:hypothetical protein AK812_SmicGene32223 [Symbiodinium microadriaticum]